MAGKERLDQILLRLGYITEEQLRNSLARQREHGGRIGAALMYFRYISESQLVEALALQFGVPGAVLSQFEISDELAGLIPQKVMKSRLAIAIDYDPNENTLAIAVADPLQVGLADELGFVARGKRVQLYVATEVAIQTEIAKITNGTNDTIESKLMLQFPDGVLEEAKSAEGEATGDPTHTARVDHILILTDEEFSAPNIKSVIERDGVVVTIITSLDELPTALQSCEFSAVYLQEKMAEDRSALTSAVRAHNRRSKVYWFRNSSDWLVNGLHEYPELDTGREYDILVNMLLADTCGVSGKNEAAVRYVSGVCDRLGVCGSEKRALLIMTQMYTIAHSLKIAQPSQNGGRQRLKSIAKFFESAQSSQTVVEPMMNAYQQIELSQLSGDVSSELLAANIITTLDIVYQWIAEREHITLDEFEELRHTLNSQTGKLLLPYVTDAMLLAVQERYLESELDEPSVEAVIYRSSSAETNALRELMLLDRSIRLVNAFTSDDLNATINRRKPDVIILTLPSDESALQKTMEMMLKAKADFSQIPTIVLTDCDSRTALESLYASGVLDTMPMETSANILSAKIKSVVERARSASDSTLALKGEARGDLENMNLIDLIQAMGPGRKTVEITLEHEDKSLKLFMVEGQIVHAEGCGEVGPEAIFEGVQWQQGSFIVRKTGVAEIPAPNIEVSNEHILMEGCRLMDETLLG